MKKSIPLLLLFFLLSLCLSACSGETGVNTLSEPSDSEPSSVSPADCSALEALMRCQTVTEEASSFSAVSEGTCDTQVLFFNYRQLLRSERVVRSDAMFSQSISTSSLVRVGVQQYFQNGMVLVRSGEVHSMEEVVWAERPVSVTPESYRSAYGNTPRGLSNYLLNETTVLSAEFLSHDGQAYTFVYELDPGLSTEAYARQIQTMGGLDALPVFQSATVTVTMDEAFRPLSVRYQEVYDISMQIIGSTTCKADYTEVFSDFDAEVVLPEQIFFESFLQEEVSQTYPEISSGYTFLFSLLGNSGAYNLTVTTAERTLPLHLTLDAATGSVLLRASDFDFLYLNNRYYFSVGNARVCTDAAAFNGQVLPLTSLSSSVLGAQGGTSFSDLLSHLRITTENGALLLQAEDESCALSARLDMQTMSVLSAELSFSVFGSPFRLSLEQSPVRATMPDLQEYQDITASVSALSLIGELGSSGHMEYALDISGSISFSAKLTVSLSDQPAIAMVSTSEAFPLSVYYAQDTVSAVWKELSASGSIADLTELLSLFSKGETATQESTFSSVLAEPGRLSLRFHGSTSSELTFAGSYLLFSTEAFSVRLTSLGPTDLPVPEAPETDLHLPLAELKTFFSGSVYPELLGSGTIVCNLEAQYGGEQSFFELHIATAPELSFGLTTVWNGLQTNLIYTDETFYLSNPVLQAFLDANQLETVSARFRSLLGEAERLPALPTGELSVSSVSCCADRLTVSLGSIEAVFGKDAILFSGDGWELICSGFSCLPESVSFAFPDKEDCVDLCALSERLETLKGQTYFSFTGGFSNGDMSASFSRFDIRMGEDGKPDALALDISLNGLDTHRYQLVYDGESFYLDAGGTKLFCLADCLSESLSRIRPEEAPSLLSLSTLRSVTFRNDILTVETADALFSITWEQNEISQLLYASKTAKMLLKKSTYTPILAPSLDGYADISPIGDLLLALYATADSGSFSFSGQMDLRALSLSLRDMKAEGTFARAETGWEGVLSVEVPYLKGMTSAGIPLSQGFRVLHTCTIHTELFLCGGNLYFRREILAEYGLFQPKTVAFTDTAYQSVDEFLASPEEAIAFICNLEDSISEKISGGGVQDPAEINPLKRFSCTGNRYLLELNPDALLPAADSITLTLETDGTYLTGAEAELSLSVLSLTASGAFADHGRTDVSASVLQDFSAYPHLHS